MKESLKKVFGKSPQRQEVSFLAAKQRKEIGSTGSYPAPVLPSPCRPHRHDDKSKNTSNG